MDHQNICCWSCSVCCLTRKYFNEIRLVSIKPEACHRDTDSKESVAWCVWSVQLPTGVKPFIYFKDSWTSCLYANEQLFAGQRIASRETVRLSEVSLHWDSSSWHNVGCSLRCWWRTGHVACSVRSECGVRRDWSWNSHGQIASQVRILRHSTKLDWIVSVWSLAICLLQRWFVDNYTSRVRSASRFCARTTSFRALHRRNNLYGGGIWTEGSFLRRRPSNLLPRGSVRRSITCSANFFLRRVNSTMDGSKSTETQSNKDGVDLARFASTNSTMLYSSSVDSWGADSAFIPRSRSWSYLR